MFPVLNLPLSLILAAGATFLKNVAQERPESDLQTEKSLAQIMRVTGRLWRENRRVTDIRSQHDLIPFIACF